jgi:hypothetical protein
MTSLLAEGVGFEPTLGLLLSLISSQVPSTTQPPFQPDESSFCSLQKSFFAVPQRENGTHFPKFRAASIRQQW